MSDNWNKNHGGNDPIKPLYGRLWRLVSRRSRRTLDLLNRQRHGEIGEPVAKPACTVSVQFAFKVFILRLSIFSAGLFLFTLSEEDAIIALGATSVRTYWTAEENHLTSNDFVWHFYCSCLVTLREIHSLLHPQNWHTFGAGSVFCLIQLSFCMGKPYGKYSQAEEKKGGNRGLAK